MIEAWKLYADSAGVTPESIKAIVLEIENENHEWNTVVFGDCVAFYAFTGILNSDATTINHPALSSFSQLEIPHRGYSDPQYEENVTVIEIANCGLGLHVSRKRKAA